jgi:hypothetical protein
MAKEVAQPASRRHDHRHANHIDDEHPLDLMQISADAGHDLRDGDVDNSRIQGKQESPYHDGPGHPPFIGGAVGEGVWAYCRWVRLSYYVLFHRSAID